MSLSIRWLGQAGYVLERKGKRLVIDPYCSDAIAEKGFVRGYPSPIPPGGLDTDVLISTHHHGDHCDPVTMRNYISFQRFYGPTSCVELLQKTGFSLSVLNALNRGEGFVNEAFSVLATFAEHTPDSIGLVVEAGEHRLYFSGDSLMHPKLLQIKAFKPDILFICINGKYGNMNWREAADLAKKLEVRSAIPMHYDMFPNNAENPALFINAVRSAGLFSRELERNRTYAIEDFFA